MNNKRKNPIVPFIISIVVFGSALMVTFGGASFYYNIPGVRVGDETVLFFGLIFGLLLFIFHRWAKWVIN